MAKKTQAKWRKFISYKIIGPIFFIAGLILFGFSAVSLFYVAAPPADEGVFAWLFLICGLLFMAVPFVSYRLDKNYEADKGGKQYKACICKKDPQGTVHLNIIERWWFYVSVGSYALIFAVLILSLFSGVEEDLIPLVFVVALLFFSDGLGAYKRYRTGHTLICSARFGVLKTNDTEK